MLGVVLYNLVEFLNYFLTYKIVMKTQFTKKKLPYIIALGSSCVVQSVVYCTVDETWRDIIAVGMSLLCVTVLTEHKKWKTVFLYPIVWALASFINIVGSFFLAIMLGITQAEVCKSVILTCVAECTAIIVLVIYSKIKRKKKREEISFSTTQYLLLLLGIGCFFIIIGFSQGIMRNEFEFLNNIKGNIVMASILLAFCFMGLSIYQHITWKKAFQYRAKNEKYELFLTKQEEHIRMLILEDEKWRKLRHDMNAHILAMDTMIEKEEWEEVQQYFYQMKKSIEETKIEKYTSISAVDAIISEWHELAVKDQVSWSWEGKLVPRESVSIFELCTLFSNLLSNAVEATKKVTEEKKIEIRVTNFQEQMILSVGNTCIKQIDIKSRPKTTKENEFFHGLGLKNVEEIINSHGGSIKYHGKEGWFQVDIVL